MLTLRLLVPALVGATLAAGSLSGCNLSPASAEPKADPCKPAFPNIPLPAVVDWNGAPLQLDAHSVLLLDPDPQHAKTYIAYQVQWMVPSIPAAVRVPSDKLPTFLDQSVLASVGVRNPPPPPPPVVDLVQGLLQTARDMDTDRYTVF
jgi:hypothetical protein